MQTTCFGAVVGSERECRLMKSSFYKTGSSGWCNPATLPMSILRIGIGSFLFIFLFKLKFFSFGLYPLGQVVLNSWPHYSRGNTWVKLHYRIKGKTGLKDQAVETQIWNNTEVPTIFSVGSLSYDLVHGGSFDLCRTLLSDTVSYSKYTL